MTIEELDQGDEIDVAPRLLECCGSSNWVTRMLAVRPFATLTHVQRMAAEIWEQLTPEDWLEAFAKHPQIGANGAISAWSSEEQSGMNSAAVEIAGRLAELNREYFEKFGWIFIVCATGKSAETMLHLLELRLPNPPDVELEIAVEEQSKIMRLRLEKLLA
jgi:2-oxo-4-hydroxy-4-carboxy-5-ureidoimidazoline decarboxylase